MVMMITLGTDNNKESQKRKKRRKNNIQGQETLTDKKKSRR